MIRIAQTALCFFLFYLILLPPCHAQAVVGGPAADNDSLRLAIRFYTQSNAAASHLYNGTLYAGYNHQAQGHPFFQSDSLLTGSVDYDGILYPDIPLAYDIEKEEVIIPDRHRTVQIRLRTEKLTWFSIGEHHFTRLAADSSSANAPHAGFYEVLYNGKATALARHQKTLQPIGRTEDNGFRYHQYDTWYILLNGRYHTIRNNHELLQLLYTPNNALKEYLKRSRLSFKKDPEYTLAKATEFYSLSN